MSARRDADEELAARAILEDIHSQVSATLARIDASHSEIRVREQALADGTFRAQVVAETTAWFDAHPEEAEGLMELFAPAAIS